MIRNNRSIPWAALVLPFIWVAATGCGGGAEPPADAGKAEKPKVDLGTPEPAAKKDAGEEPVAEGWGDLKGRITFVGDVPEPTVLVREGDPNAKDAEVCAAHTIHSQELVVNEESMGIQHVFVYLRRAPRVAPELAEAAEEPIVLDQKGCTFLPHGVIARVDQGVLVKSDDPIRHNTHTHPLRNQGFNQILAPNDREGIEMTFTTGENLPFRVTCDIHPWMLSHILVLDHPYATTTDENGEFLLEKLPAGELDVTIWQEKAGYIERARKVSISDGETTELNIEVQAETFQ